MPAADVNPVVLENPDSKVTVRLPKGTYLIDNRTSAGDDVTMLVHPGLTLNSSQIVVLDARLGKPVSIGLPRTSVTPLPLLSEVTYDVKTLDGREMYDEWAGGQESFDRLSVAQIGTGRRDDLVTKIGGQWAVPGPGGDLTDSPAAYRLAWFVRGQVPTGFVRNVEQKDLATVHRDYAVQWAGSRAEVGSRALPADRDFPSSTFVIGFSLPFLHTEYHNTDDGIRWQHGTREQLADDIHLVDSPPVRYAAGRVYTEKWNRGVFGPVLIDSRELPLVTHTGNVIQARPALFGDGAGRTGASSLATAHIALYRDGRLVTEAPRPFLQAVQVPPGDAAYRLQVEAGRPPAATLSTRVSVTWTFRSATVQDGTAALPLSVVGFSPELDRRNTAPAAQPFTVPLTVRKQTGSAAGEVRDLSVDVSYDDGASWQAAKVARSGANGTVLLRHPAVDGFVSLRARSKDSAGNTVEQTIIRAYRIAR
ncbi:hypothetical protein [Nonomuraea sp. NPDC049695]|uniref:hypothetical protein n=1 Tax=Nonomuraea sp. NPDC049695 TaxID=3154734 RepID=UPI003412E598